MVDLNKLRNILTIVFLVCFVALIAEVTYILCRKRRKHPTTDIELGREENAKLPSKELLYFFCWKTRVEPDDHSSSERGTAPPLPPLWAEAEEEDDVLEKWKQDQVFIGPSRVLFTITEEEREGSAFSEDDAVLVTKLGRTSSESFEVEFDVDDMTPFWTPCASPAYYSPSPSPSHDQNLSPKDDVVFVSCNCVTK